MRKTRPPHLLRTLLLSLGALVGCSETKVLDELTVTPIGPSGGIATSADGLFAVEFPGGTVAAAIQVRILTVRSLVPSGVIGPVYDLSDNSFSFTGSPRLRITASEGAPGYEIVEIAASGITPVDGSIEDERTRRVTAPFKRHGRYGLRRHAHAQPDAGFEDAQTGTTAPDAGFEDAQTGTTAPDAGLTLDAGQLPDSGTFTGTTGPMLCAEPSMVDFGQVALGSSAQATVTIRNCGSVDIQIFGPMFQQSTLGFSADPLSYPISTHPGDTLSLTLRFTPQIGATVTTVVAMMTDSIVGPMIFLRGNAGVPLARCTVLAVGGSCDIEVAGDNIFPRTRAASRDFEVSASGPNGCLTEASVDGPDFSGVATGTGTPELPKNLTLEVGFPVTVRISHVLTGTPAAGRLHFRGIGGDDCPIDLLVQ